ncbi:hypothetical protein FXO38_03145 [Capsicum annuum]|nr:hypothetical protein FXO38_03145 [Capsicum annuum]
MSHPNPDPTPALEDSKSDQPPAPSIAPEIRSGKRESCYKEDPDNTLHQPKRRKNCPTALDKFDSLNSVTNFGFSFSFDSKFSGCSTPEVTPKFGSFNRVKPGSSKDSKSEETELKEGGKSDVIVEKNSLDLLTVD